ncbi:MAG: protein-L-isoaspartate(D-aspartate) O-methyltransferase [bacterium]|nr:protein-L-isoaspartate(D-aspartate) O-methyltransferase [candidate division KSB1 bacterium]MDH7558732.1 protein-L-isoaspartate(D-aspartate) O-methyltransferase [bacterium]
MKSPKTEQRGRQPETHEAEFAQQRLRMVESQIAAREVKDPLVLEAMRKVPRHLFVPDNLRDSAYDDSPLPIGHGQTISQPYIVAFMTECLRLKGGERVLEVGTGSGYQAAVLAEIVDSVFSIEIVGDLALQAKERLKRLGYKNVNVRQRDGYRGLPDKAPFDAIIVTAAPDHIPQPLVEQLKVGGRMVIPVGSMYQELVVVTKMDEKRVKEESVLPVRFVPMTGEAERKPRHRN